ncbi:MAG: glycosyltransferase family 2 protein [Prevotella sp.]|nr:glycosyltransferase family 2 protein [Prevotella sp.]
MKTAVVILNWNGRKMMEQYLPSVMEHTSGDASVIVADNASSDDSLAFLEENYPDVRIIRLEENYGFADGYNRALKQVEADYFVLLNSDVEVTPHWLEPLVDYMDAHEEVAACQPKILSYVAKGKFEYAGASGGFIDKYGYPFCRGRVFDMVEEDEGQYDDVYQIHWATGACLLIRSKDYWAVGGLDSRYFAHNEEIDFCWRLRILGRQIVCQPSSVIYHLGGGTLPKGNSRKTFLNFRNNLTMLYKCLPDEEMNHVMRWRWFLDYLAAWQTLILNFNYGDFKAIYRARRAFKKWKSDFAADRQQIQQSRVVDWKQERKRYSILWLYYVKRLRKYMDFPA